MPLLASSSLHEVEGKKNYAHVTMQENKFFCRMYGLTVILPVKILIRFTVRVSQRLFRINSAKTKV